MTSAGMLRKIPWSFLACHFLFAVETLDLGAHESRDYVDYYPGSDDTNIVMTAPHDGDYHHPDIPDRMRGCYLPEDKTCQWNHDCGERTANKCFAVTWADLRSSDFAKVIREEISRLTGKTPHLIVSRMHRSKLDPNRFRDDAAQYNAIAGKTYDTFHGWILDVHEKLAARGNPAVHFDIHGYTLHNTDNWMELGYNLRGGELNRGEYTPDTSSIRSLAGRSPYSLQALVNGDVSLGRFVQEEGFRVVPSPEYPTPDTGIEGRYFRGGYITRKWGSLEGGNIDCVQLEVPQWIRDDVDLHGPKFGKAFATWVNLHYQEEE